MGGSTSLQDLQQELRVQTHLEGPWRTRLEAHATSLVQREHGDRAVTAVLITSNSPKRRRTQIAPHRRSVDRDLTACGGTQQSAVVGKPMVMTLPVQVLPGEFEDDLVPVDDQDYFGRPLHLQRREPAWSSCDCQAYRSRPSGPGQPARGAGQTVPRHF